MKPSNSPPSRSTAKGQFPTSRLPRGGGKSTTGSVFSQPDGEITYELALPDAVPDAKLIICFARLHFRSSMRPAKLDLTLTQAGSSAKHTVSFGDTQGWGTNDASEWDLVEMALGTDLDEGPLTLRFSTSEGNSNVNIDGFFIAPADFKITRNETQDLQRIRISSEGYIGLSIPGDTVFPGAFDGFEGGGQAQSCRGSPIFVRTWRPGS